MAELHVIIGGVFVLLGMAVSYVFLSKALKAIKTNQWPSVYGELKSTELKNVVFVGVREGATRDGSVTTLVNFEYSYEVDGKNYDGKRVTMSDFVHKTGGCLSKLQERYKGQESLVKVYYNPLKPSDSVLIPGAGIYNFTPLITTFGFIGAGVYMMSL